MLRSTKEVLVGEFNSIFAEAQAGILIDFQGTSVADLTAVRKALNAKGAKLRVVKNSLAKIASEGTPYEGLKDDFVKTRALAYSSEDPVGVAKVIADQAKTIETMQLISGVLVTGEKGKVLSEADIKALGEMPSREDLLCKLLYVLNAPTTNFVRTLNEVPASFARVLSAVAESKN